MSSPSTVKLPFAVKKRGRPRKSKQQVIKCSPGVEPDSTTGTSFPSPTPLPVLVQSPRSQDSNFEFENLNSRYLPLERQTNFTFCADKADSPVQSNVFLSSDPVDLVDGPLNVNEFGDSPAVCASTVQTLDYQHLLEEEFSIDWSRYGGDDLLSYLGESKKIEEDEEMCTDSFHVPCSSQNDSSSSLESVDSFIPSSFHHLRTYTRHVPPSSSQKPSLCSSSSSNQLLNGDFGKGENCGNGDQYEVLEIIDDDNNSEVPNNENVVIVYCEPDDMSKTGECPKPADENVVHPVGCTTSISCMRVIPDVLQQYVVGDISQTQYNMPYYLVQGAQIIVTAPDYSDEPSGSVIVQESVLNDVLLDVNTLSCIDQSIIIESQGVNESNKNQANDMDTFLLGTDEFHRQAAVADILQSPPAPIMPPPKRLVSVFPTPGISPSRELSSPVRPTHSPLSGASDTPTPEPPSGTCSPHEEREEDFEPDYDFDEDHGSYGSDDDKQEDPESIAGGKLQESELHHFKSLANFGSDPVIDTSQSNSDGAEYAGPNTSQAESCEMGEGLKDVVLGPRLSGRHSSVDSSDSEKLVICEAGSPNSVGSRPTELLSPGEVPDSSDVLRDDSVCGPVVTISPSSRKGRQDLDHIQIHSRPRRTKSTTEKTLQKILPGWANEIGQLEATQEVNQDQVESSTRDDPRPDKSELAAVKHGDADDDLSEMKKIEGDANKLLDTLSKSDSEKIVSPDSITHEEKDAAAENAALSSEVNDSASVVQTPMSLNSDESNGKEDSGNRKESPLIQLHEFTSSLFGPCRPPPASEVTLQECVEPRSPTDGSDGDNNSSQANVVEKPVIVEQNSSSAIESFEPAFDLDMLVDLSDKMAQTESSMQSNAAVAAAESDLDIAKNSLSELAVETVISHLEDPKSRTFNVPSVNPEVLPSEDELIDVENISIQSEVLVKTKPKSSALEKSKVQRAKKKPGRKSSAQVSPPPVDIGVEAVKGESHGKKMKINRKLVSSSDEVFKTPAVSNLPTLSGGQDVPTCERPKSSKRKKARSSAAAAALSATGVLAPTSSCLSIVPPVHVIPNVSPTCSSPGSVAQSPILDMCLAKFIPRKHLYPYVNVVDIKSFVWSKFGQPDNSPPTPVNRSRPRGRPPLVRNKTNTIGSVKGDGNLSTTDLKVVNSESNAVVVPKVSKKRPWKKPQKPGDVPEKKIKLVNLPEKEREISMAVDEISSCEKEITEVVAPKESKKDKVKRRGSVDGKNSMAEISMAVDEISSCEKEITEVVAPKESKKDKVKRRGSVIGKNLMAEISMAVDKISSCEKEITEVVAPKESKKDKVKRRGSVIGKKSMAEISMAVDEISSCEKEITEVVAPKESKKDKVKSLILNESPMSCTPEKEHGKEDLLSPKSGTSESHIQLVEHVLEKKVKHKKRRKSDNTATDDNVEVTQNTNPQRCILPPPTKDLVDAKVLSPKLVLLQEKIGSPILQLTKMNIGIDGPKSSVEREKNLKKPISPGELISTPKPQVESDPAVKACSDKSESQKKCISKTLPQKKGNQSLPVKISLDYVSKATVVAAVKSDALTDVVPPQDTINESSTLTPVSPVAEALKSLTTKLTTKSTPHHHHHHHSHTKHTTTSKSSTTKSAPAKSPQPTVKPTLSNKSVPVKTARTTNPSLVGNVTDEGLSHGSSKPDQVTSPTVKIAVAAGTVTKTAHVAPKAKHAASNIIKPIHVLTACKTHSVAPKEPTIVPLPAPLSRIPKKSPALVSEITAPIVPTSKPPMLHSPPLKLPKTARPGHRSVEDTRKVQKTEDIHHIIEKQSADAATSQLTIGGKKKRERYSSDGQSSRHSSDGQISRHSSDGQISKHSSDGQLSRSNYHDSAASQSRRTWPCKKENETPAPTRNDKEVAVHPKVDSRFGKQKIYSNQLGSSCQDPKGAKAHTSEHGGRERTVEDHGVRKVAIKDPLSKPVLPQDVVRSSPCGQEGPRNRIVVQSHPRRDVNLSTSDTGHTDRRRSATPQEDTRRFVTSKSSPTPPYKPSSASLCPDKRLVAEQVAKEVSKLRALTEAEGGSRTSRAVDWGERLRRAADSVPCSLEARAKQRRDSESKQAPPQMSEPPDLGLRTVAAGSTPLPDEVERIDDEVSGNSHPKQLTPSPMSISPLDSVDDQLEEGEISDIPPSTRPPVIPTPPKPHATTNTSIPVAQIEAPTPKEPVSVAHKLTHHVTKRDEITAVGVSHADHQLWDDGTPEVELDIVESAYEDQSGAQLQPTWELELAAQDLLARKFREEEERVSPEQPHDNHQAEEMSLDYDLPDYQIEMPTPSAWIKLHRAHIVGMNTHINFEHLTSESWLQYDPQEKEQDSITKNIRRAAQNLQFNMLARSFMVCVFTSLRAMLTCIPVFTRALLGTDGDFTNVPTNLANFIQAVEREKKEVLNEAGKRHMATIGLRLLIICMEKNKLAEAVTLLRYMHSKNLNYHRPSTHMKVHPAMTMLTALQVCVASQQYDELPNIFMVANSYEPDTEAPEGMIRKLRVQMVGECLAVLVGVCRQRSCNQQAKPYLVDLVDKLFKNLMENQPKDHETVHGYRDMIDFPELHNYLLQFMLEVHATTHVISIYNCLFWRDGLLCIRPRVLRNLVFYFFEQQSENGLYLDEASNVVRYGTEVGVYPKMQDFEPRVGGRVVLWTCMHAYEMLLVIRAHLLDMFNYYKQRNMIKDGLRKRHFTSIGLIINLAPKPEVSDICDQAYTSTDCKSMIKAQEDLVSVFKKMLSMKWKQRDFGDFSIDAVSIWSFFLEYDEKLQHQSSTQGYMSPDRRFMPPKPLRNRSDTELLRNRSNKELLPVGGITPTSHPQRAEQPVASQSMPEMGVQPSSGLSQFMNGLVTDRIKENVNNQIMSSLSAAGSFNDGFASKMMNAAPIRPDAVHSRSSLPHVKAQNQRRGGAVPPKHTSGVRNSVPYRRHFPGVNKITADQPSSPRFPINTIPGRTSRDVQRTDAGNYHLPNSAGAADLTVPPPLSTVPPTGHVSGEPPINGPLSQRSLNQTPMVDGRKLRNAYSTLMPDDSLRLPSNNEAPFFSDNSIDEGDRIEIHAFINPETFSNQSNYGQQEDPGRDHPVNRGQLNHQTHSNYQEQPSHQAQSNFQDRSSRQTRSSYQEPPPSHQVQSNFQEPSPSHQVQPNFQEWPSHQARPNFQEPPPSLETQPNFQEPPPSRQAQFNFQECSSRQAPSNYQEWPSHQTQPNIQEPPSSHQAQPNFQEPQSSHQARPNFQEPPSSHQAQPNFQERSSRQTQSNYQEPPPSHQAPFNYQERPSSEAPSNYQERTSCQTQPNIQERLSHQALSSYQDQPSHRGHQSNARRGHVSEHEYSDYSDHQGGQNSKVREISPTTEEYTDFRARDEEDGKGQHHWNITNVKHEKSSDSVPYEGYFEPESPGHDESRGPVSFTERVGGNFALGNGPASFSPARRGNPSDHYSMNQDGADGYEQQYERDYPYEEETAYKDFGYDQQYAHLQKENEHLNVTDQPQARRQSNAMLAVHHPEPDPSVIGAHLGPSEAPPAPQRHGQVYTPSFAPPEEQPVFQEVVDCVATRLRFHVQQRHFPSRNVEEYKVWISKMFCEQLVTTYQGQVHSLSDQDFEELSVFVDAKISLGRGGAM